MLSIGDDSFDKAKVKKLLDALIKDCNVVPSSYKVSILLRSDSLNPS